MFAWTSSGAVGGTVVHKVRGSAWSSCELGYDACAALIVLVSCPAGVLIREVSVGYLTVIDTRIDAVDALYAESGCRVESATAVLVMVDSTLCVALGWVDDSSIVLSSIVIRLASTVLVTYIETRSYWVILVNAVSSCECGAVASDFDSGCSIGVDLGLG